MKNITLTKLKYRNPQNRTLHRTGIDPVGGTRVYSAGTFKSKTSNAGKAAPAKQGTGPRRKQGLGAVGN